MVSTREGSRDEDALNLLASWAATQATSDMAPWLLC